MEGKDRGGFKRTTTSQIVKILDKKVILQFQFLSAKSTTETCVKMKPLWISVHQTAVEPVTEAVYKPKTFTD